MRARFEMSPSPDPWGGRQPPFERLAWDGDSGFFLDYELPSGEPVRAQLVPFDPGEHAESCQPRGAGVASPPRPAAARPPPLLPGGAVLRGRRRLSGSAAARV